MSEELKLAPGVKINDFNKYCESIFGKIKTNTSQTRTLETLRDTLLPKLMSGAVRVALDRAAA